MRRRGRKSCHYLHGPFCLGMQINDWVSSACSGSSNIFWVWRHPPADVVIQSCLPPLFPSLISRDMGAPRLDSSQPTIEEKLGESLSGGTCVRALTREDTQNANLDWIPVTRGIKSDESHPTPAVHLTEHPSKSCSQDHQFQREGARDLPRRKAPTHQYLGKKM